MRELSVVSLVQVTVCWFVELILVPNFQHSNKEKNHFQSVKQTSNSSTAEQTRVYTHICLPFFNPNSYIYINKCCVHITSSLHKLTKIFILVLPKKGKLNIPSQLLHYYKLKVKFVFVSFIHYIEHCHGFPIQEDLPHGFGGHLHSFGCVSSIRSSLPAIIIARWSMAEAKWISLLVDSTRSSTTITPRSDSWLILNMFEIIMVDYLEKPW